MPPQIPARIRAIELPPFDPLNARAAELRRQGHRVISLGQALPFFAPPLSATAAARRALDNGCAHDYVTDPGLPSLRDALAGRLKGTARIDAQRDDLIITAGANHGFALATATLLEGGDEVLLPAPYFTNHEMMVRTLGAIAVEVPIADRVRFAVRWADIEPYLTPRTKAVVLCNPSNPTGAPIDADEGRRIVAALADRDVFVIADETYMQFVYGAAHWSAASVDGWRRNAVVVGSFSKAFGMMGWRVGFLLADARVCAEAVKVQDAMIICAPAIAQAAAEGAVRDDWTYPLSFHGEMLRRRAILKNVVDAIPRLSWTPADGAFFGFVRVDGCVDSAALATALLEQAQVVTIPGSAFGRSGEGYLRLSYGAAAPDDLCEAGRRLARYFQEE